MPQQPKSRHFNLTDTLALPGIASRAILIGNGLMQPVIGPLAGNP